MSVIEDSRKVLQDFVAPELRAIIARIEALEKRFDISDQRTEKRFDQIESRADQRHSEVLNAIHRVADYSAIMERLARLESQQSASH